MMTFTRRTATALGFAVLAAPASALAQSDADRRFAALAARFIDQSLALQPAFATQQGDHRFDDQIDDVSAAGLARQVALARTLLAEADALRPEQLSRENQVDLAVLKNQLRYGIWTDEVLQSWAWDPQIYSGIAGNALFGLMARDYAPRPQRLKAAIARMVHPVCKGVWIGLNTDGTCASESAMICRARSRSPPGGVMNRSIKRCSRPGTGFPLSWMTSR